MTGTRHLCMYYKCSWDYNIFRGKPQEASYMRQTHNQAVCWKPSCCYQRGWGETALWSAVFPAQISPVISGDSDVAWPQTRPVWSCGITIYFVVCTFNNLQQFLTLLNILAQNNNKKGDHNDDNIIYYFKNASMIILTCNLTLTVLISWPSM